MASTTLYIRTITHKSFASPTDAIRFMINIIYLYIENQQIIIDNIE